MATNIVVYGCNADGLFNDNSPLPLRLFHKPPGTHHPDWNRDNLAAGHPRNMRGSRLWGGRASEKEEWTVPGGEVWTYVYMNIIWGCERWFSCICGYILCACEGRRWLYVSGKGVPYVCVCGGGVWVWVWVGGWMGGEGWVDGDEWVGGGWVEGGEWVGGWMGQWMNGWGVGEWVDWWVGGQVLHVSVCVYVWGINLHYSWRV